MRILFIGDVHGMHRQLADSLRQVQTDYRIEAAVQVGDFGFYKATMRQLAEEAIRFPIPLHVIDGNHEDHHWLQQALEAGRGPEWQAQYNLFYQPRPSIRQFGLTKVVFIGGALHVDRPQQHNVMSRSPNYILAQQREQARILFNRERPDLIVTHSCPSRIGIGMRASDQLQQQACEHILAAGFDPGPVDDCGDTELTVLWQQLDYRPRAWIFGHFHSHHEAVIEGTRFVSVCDDINSMGRTLAIWDTEEKFLMYCFADPSQ